MDLPVTFAVVLGGVILIVYAWKKYETSDEVAGPSAHLNSQRQELRGVRMSALTTPTEYSRGKGAYVVSFLGLYVLFALFPEFMQILLEGLKGPGGAELQTANTEAKTYFSGETTKDAPPVIPFWIAIAIAGGATTPTFGAVEKTIRSVAYFFAGIPRGIHRVLKNIEEFNFSEVDSDDHLPLTKTYKKFISENDIDGAIQATVDHTIDTLRIIDLLQGPVIGPQRTTFWDVFEGAAPLEKITDCTARYHRLGGDLKALTPHNNSLEAFFASAQKLADSMQCLFALFAIRNTPMPKHLSDTITGRIVNDVTIRKSPQSINSILLASILGGLLAIISVSGFAVYTKGAGLDGGFVEAVNLLIQNDPVMGPVKKACSDLLVPLIPSVTVVAILTILARESKIVQRIWPEFSFFRVPMTSYLQAALIPLFFGLLTYSVFLVVEMLMKSEIKQMEFSAYLQASLVYLIGKSVELLRLAVLFLCLSIAVLYIADSIHKRAHWQVILFAVLGAYIFFGAVLLVFVLTGELGNTVFASWQMSIMLVTPICWLIGIYALAAYLGRDKGKGTKGSVSWTAIASGGKLSANATS